MPKLKTKKALAKRAKVTKKGKVLCSKAGRRHLLSGKSKKRKRALRKKKCIPAGQKQFAKRALPYTF